MSDMSVDEVKRHVRIYVTVFVALLALTVITVAISTLHLKVAAAVVVAVFIAIIKGSLVASYFMHLISEKKLIYAALILTAIFLLALLFLPISEISDRIAR